MPVTLEQHERKLHDPALCEQLPVRDYLDNIVVRTNGAFVAGYELKGLRVVEDPSESVESKRYSGSSGPKKGPGAHAGSRTKIAPARCGAR